jgi:DnaJ-class molecular chaperone
MIGKKKEQPRDDSKLEVKAKQPCTACSGKGIDPQDETKYCGECHGSGTISK